jgi:predicted PurR-regulated permease PerM
VASSSTTKSQDAFFTLGGLVLVTACLYWARQVLIPVSLAVLLAFVLMPAVSALQRRGLGRLPSVILVVVLARLLLGGTGYVISRQLDNLVSNLPNYRGEIIKKVEALRDAGKDGIVGRILSFFQDVSEQVENKIESSKGKGKGTPLTPSIAEGIPDAREDEKATKSDKPEPGTDPGNPLYVQWESSGWSKIAESIGPAAEGLGAAFLVLVLVVFMLIQRENLRNRFVRLFGHGRLILTTQAFDEGAQRISRFLLMQLLINSIFGVALALGLFAAGLILGHRQLWQYAVLWGFLAIVFRFVPYVGTWIVAALMMGYSIATLPGWTLPLAIFGYFLLLELLTANVVEPLLFGHSTGVAPMALLLAAAFWTWLWGPVGLLLSTPLTVILVILGKYVSELHFFEVLLGDEPVLSTDVTFYQRLVARDRDEAADLVEEYLAKNSPQAVYEEVLLPALLHAKLDRDRDELEAENYEFVLQGIRDSEEDLASALAEHVKEVPGANKAVAIGCPGDDETDELALQMLAQMTRLTGYSLEVVSAKKLTAEVLTYLEQANPTLVVIGLLPPGGLARARYLCKRIRQQAPNLKILIGRWGESTKNERLETRLLGAGADQVGWTLHESVAQIVPLLQVAANAAPAEPSKSGLVTTP